MDAQKQTNWKAIRGLSGFIFAYAALVLLAVLFLTAVALIGRVFV